MADEQPAGTGGSRTDGSAPGRSPIVFISDATVETERIGDTLRAAGYVVLDVPLVSLVARVAAQRPNVVLFDIDAENVLDELARLRKVPGSGAVDFVFLGNGDGVVKNMEDALANDGSAFFVRPIDVAALVRKVEALTGGPVKRPEARPSTPPPSLPPRSANLYTGLSRPEPPSSDRAAPSQPSLPAPGVRTAGPPLPMSTTSLADLVTDPNDPHSPRSLASFGSVSIELQQLLADAELRAEMLSMSEIALPTPEEEIESVLPADVLASLDEPLDHPEDEEVGDGGRSHGTHDRHESTNAHAKGTTTGGSRQLTTGAGSRSVQTGGTGSQTHERRLTTDTPPRAVTGDRGSSSPSLARARAGDSPVPRFRGDDSPLPRMRSDDSPPPRLRSEEPPPRLRSEEPTPLPRPRSEAPSAQPAAKPSSWHPPPSIVTTGLSASIATEPMLRGPSVRPGPDGGAIVIVAPEAARRFFADAITRRASGALCFESEGIVRRIVIRDGDLVAAASGGELESLVHFLAARGELARDEATRLAPKIPPYGRHAGAALVAHGWLRQDQLWVVLRAHAEWIASAVLRLSRGSAQLEADPPGRLRGEPSVFAAATGAEIFVELVRRAVPPQEALALLGGEGARLADGPHQALLAECSLSPQDLELLSRARGGTIGDLLARATDGEILAVVHALALLGVMELIAAPDFRGRDAPPSVDPEVAALDEEAIRARVRARLELVEEGDYFAVLGVTRDATGYEVRRAFLELRRTFEPARLLTPRLLDLSGDVRKIVIVIEEAYEILRDNARRERYRRAIDARPE